jgi:hypothetical protein
MSREQNLIDVKLALADKYTRLSHLAGSVPKRKTYARMATKYRRQAEQIRRDSTQ